MEEVGQEISLGLDGLVNVTITRFFGVKKQGLDFNDISMPIDSFVEKCNHIVCHYLETEWQNEAFISTCLYPGLWLHIPDSWVNESNR